MKGEQKMINDVLSETWLDDILDNQGYFFWLLANMLIFLFIFGFSMRTFLIITFMYAIAISLALSPLGEKILQYKCDVRRLCTNVEKERLIPVWWEVYQKAAKNKSCMNQDINLYMVDEIVPYAFSIGRKTIALSRGIVEIMDDEELKGIIAHEIAHIAKGDTIARLICSLGNTVIVWGVYFLRFVSSKIIDSINKTSIFGFTGRIVLRFFDAILWLFTILVSL
jgi:Zn-dependent protease with chaperone function